MSGLRADLTCDACGTVQDPATFLDGITHAMAILPCAKFRCPACGAGEDVGIVDGEISFGYVYSGPHWAGMEPVSVPGLRTTWSFDTLTIEFAGWIWEIPRNPR